MNNECALIADTRESHVLRHNTEFNAILHFVMQITTGDYVVLSPTNTILCVIERKSLEDFAASLKDGRHDNKNKLVKLRDETGCRIIFIIEGPEFPDPNKLFARMPYRYIESAIFHLMIRDGVSIMRTRDTLETARALVRFVQSMNTLCKKCTDLPGGLSVSVIRSNNLQAVTQNNEKNNPTAVPNVIDLTNNLQEVTQNNSTAVPNVIDPENNLQEVTQNNTLPAIGAIKPIEEIVGAAGSREEIVARLTIREEKPIEDIVRTIWSCFPGITVESASEYMKKWSIADIICGRVSADDLRAHRLSGGRRVNKKVIDSLSYNHKLAKQSNIHTRMLTRVPGISAQSATKILETATLPNLLSWNCASMSIIPATKSGRKLGEVLAGRIISLFNYRAA